MNTQPKPSKKNDNSLKLAGIFFLVSISCFAIAVLFAIVGGGPMIGVAFMPDITEFTIFLFSIGVLFFFFCLIMLLVATISAVCASSDENKK